MPKTEFGTAFITGVFKEIKENMEIIAGKAR
jgi:hypothetical protein